ncbi:MAG TPA: hypothetical protein QGF35_00575 [Dehalococcoidia bacterium]|nr:hypothetical protein [Dehalococcoidia bacterium]
MTVEVRWFSTLIPRTRSGKPVTRAELAAGLTPRTVFLAEGFSPADAEAVMAVVNDVQSNLDHELRDGDVLEFMVSIQGGRLAEENL